MTGDMQFGDVEQAEVRSALRPDRNRHYAVVACGHPADGELPIFVDLDAMQEMEEHALSDMRVELGGVMLGGQHADEDGESFVFVTDCLRAQHYESTKGSFKFTHDTWQEITRQRDEFPPDLQMVGWYHTHPSWGVFLSSLDMFICQNFFNRPLDLALVIDPCRQDRGFFQWTGQRKDRTQRTGGFYLVSSRFREEELQWYATLLGEEAAMRGDTDRGYPPQRMPMPVVNISEGRPGWLGVAVVGMLVVQVFFTMLVAWRLMVPPGAADAEPPSQTQLTALEERVEKLAEQQEDAQRLAIEREVLDRVLDRIGDPDGPERLVSELAAQAEENETLRAASTGFGSIEAKNRELTALLDESQGKTESLDKQVKRLLVENREYDDEALARDKRIAKLLDQVDDLKNPSSESDGKAEAGNGAGWLYNKWVWILGGIGVLAALAIGGALISSRSGRWDDEEPIEIARDDPTQNGDSAENDEPRDVEPRDVEPGEEERM